MSKLEILLVSPAFWLGLAVVVIEGLKAIQPSLSGTWAVVVQFILACLAATLHSKEIQVAGATGKLGSRSIVK